MPIALLTRCLIRGDAAIAPFVLTHVPALPYYDMFHESFLLQVEYSLTEETFYMVLYGRCPQCFHASSFSSLPQNVSKVKSTLSPYH